MPQNRGKCALHNAIQPHLAVPRPVSHLLCICLRRHFPVRRLVFDPELGLTLNQAHVLTPRNQGDFALGHGASVQCASLVPTCPRIRASLPCVTRQPDLSLESSGLGLGFGASLPRAVGRRGHRVCIARLQACTCLNVSSETTLSASQLTVIGKIAAHIAEAYGNASGSNHGLARRPNHGLARRLNFHCQDRTYNEGQPVSRSFSLPNEVLPKNCLKRARCQRGLLVCIRMLSRHGLIC
jgi:hypothetical protein